MWNPIQRLLNIPGAASTTRTVGGDVRRGVGAEKVRSLDTPYNAYLRKRLIEIIVVSLVIGVAVYLFIPSLAGTAESARRATCVSHLRRLAQAMEMYRTDNEGFPPTVGWVRGIYPLLTDKDGASALFCPSETHLPRPLRRHNFENSSYGYRPPLAEGGAVDEATTAIFWDYLGGSGAGAHPNGGNVAFLDGHVVWKPHTLWQNSDLP